MAALFGPAPSLRPAHRLVRLRPAGLRLAHLSFTLGDVPGCEALELLLEFVARRVREVRKAAGRLAGANKLGGERP